jgi:PhnB protein
MVKSSAFEQLDAAVQAILRTPGASLPKMDARVAPLVRLAAELRGLPRESFRARLRSELERKSTMATVAEPIAGTRSKATPQLTFKSAAKAIEFYEQAFGARETMRFEIGGMIPHAEIMIGDSVITLAEEWPEGGRFSAETLGDSPTRILLEVEDVDAFAAKAMEAGLKMISPIQSQFYGRRDGNFIDPFGYSWNIYTVKEDMSVEEMHRRMGAQGEPQQATKPAVDPIPKGYRTVTPYIVAQDADALIGFLKQAFGAEENFRAIGSAGGFHMEARIGDSMLMVGGGGPGVSWRGDALPGAFHVYVQDCDAVYQRALKAGATSIGEPKDQEYGERSAGVKDAAGNYWYIATHQGGNYVQKGLNNVNVYLHPLRAEPLIKFLRRAFGAQEIAKYASPDGVVHHAQVRVGNSMVEMGEAHGPYQPMSSMFYLYVPDCDATYRQALAAGAASMSEPADQPYGDRTAGVKDVFGNQWYIGTHIKDVAV